MFAFLRKMWPIHLAILPFTAHRILLSTFIICNASSFLTLSVQPIISISFQKPFKNFRVISDLLSQVSSFQHHTKYVPNVALDKFLRQVYLKNCWRKSLILLSLLLECCFSHIPTPNNVSKISHINESTQIGHLIKPPHHTNRS